MTANTFTFRLLRICAIGALTLGFMFVTAPATVPAVLLVVPFVGLFAFLYLTCMEIARFLGPDEDENGAIVRLRHPRLLSAITAGFPVLLLVLQSIVELSLWDVLIALAILLLAYLYVSRGSLAFWR